MLEKFPFTGIKEIISTEDYFIFSTSFSEIVARHMPTVQSVEFFEDESDFTSANEVLTQPHFLSHFQLLAANEVDCIIDGGIILMGFSAGAVNVVAAAFGADSLFLQKMSRDWFVEKKSVIEREFLLLKQARMDMLTGLLNLSNLHSLLESTKDQERLQLVLVDLPPGVTSLRQNAKHLYQCVSHLKNFVKGRSILHYIGQTSFALFLQQGPRAKEYPLEANLVAYLKKRGFSRVHVGSSKISELDQRAGNGESRLHLLDEAWTALQRAVQKGPFSFCEYHHIAFPEDYTLAPPKGHLVRKLNLWTSLLDRFSVVLFRGDNELSLAPEVIPERIEGLKHLVVDQDVYVLFPESEGTDFTGWLEDIIEKISFPDKNIHFSAGVFMYPYGDFRKSESLFCAKKALLHAHFFGPSSYAIFDHLSLNISGDVYFGDGDFNLAIKEYRRGLKCGGGDVNLFNSLGVSLVMMNRIKVAVDCFQSALNLDDTDFMALYNLGLAKQSMRLKKEAVSYFTRAYEHRIHAEADSHLIEDLLLQLGILYTETGNYQNAAAYLEDWLRKQQDGADVGHVQYYLGLSYFNLGKMKNAMQSLERALQYNGFDDRALSLLGRVYNQEGQGADIAVTLCKKSVEIDPQNTEYKLYLAEIYNSMGDFLSSRNLLKKCLGRKAAKAFAQVLMAEAYLIEEKVHQARAWFEKALNNPHCSVELTKRAKSGLKHCKK